VTKSHAYRILLARMASIRAGYALNQAIDPDAVAYDLVQLLYGDEPVPSTMLPDDALERDRELETSDAAALQVHRWHWTLNPANKERVSVGEYALAVDRHRSVIYNDAQGYAYDLEGGPPRMSSRRWR
jgi:hypothetical protein